MLWLKLWLLAATHLRRFPSSIKCKFTCLVLSFSLYFLSFVYNCDDHWCLHFFILLCSFVGFLVQKLERLHHLVLLDIFTAFLNLVATRCGQTQYGLTYWAGLKKTFWLESKFSSTSGNLLTMSKFYKRHLIKHLLDLWVYSNSKL